MRWNPAFLYNLVRKPPSQTTLPTIASPVMGMDASLTDRIYTNTSGSVLATNAQAVARINDAFGVATAHWEQADAVARPMLITGAQAGKPAIRFNGSTTYLSALGVANPGSLFQSRSFTLVFVYRRPTNYFHIGFSAGNGTSGENNQWFDQITLNLKETGHIVFDRPTGSQYANATLSSATFPPNQLVKVVARGSQADGMEVTAKGALGTFTANAAIPSSPDIWVWNTALLGSGLAAADDMSIPREPLNGDIFEFRFWASMADTTTRSNLMAYLDNKWGS